MIIQHKFTTLNQFINATRTNRYVSAKIKREETEIARLSCLGYPKLKTPCKLKFTWHITNKRTDPDNICWAKKACIDGMVKAGLLPNDSLKYIVGFQDEFVLGDIDYVEIKVIE